MPESAKLDVAAMSNEDLVETLGGLADVTETIGKAFLDGEGGADGLRLAAGVLRNGADTLDEMAKRWEARQ
jgi:hypothetical protein